MFGLFNAIGGLAGEVLKVAVAPVVIAAEVATPLVEVATEVVRPVAEVAGEVTDSIREAVSYR